MFSEIMFMIYVLSSMLESCMLGLILVMINLVRNLNLQLSIFPTIPLLKDQNGRPEDVKLRVFEKFTLIREQNLYASNSTRHVSSDCQGNTSQLMTSSIWEQ